jgi:hypothetical protein
LRADDVSDERRDCHADTVVRLYGGRKRAGSTNDIVRVTRFFDRCDSPQLVENSRSAADAPGERARYCSISAGDPPSHALEESEKLCLRHRFPELHDTRGEHGRIGTRKCFLCRRRKTKEHRWLAGASAFADAAPLDRALSLERREMETDRIVRQGQVERQLVDRPGASPHESEQLTSRSFGGGRGFSGSHHHSTPNLESFTE